MNKVSKELIGILSFIPVIYFVFMMMCWLMDLNFGTFDYIDQLHLSVLGLSFLLTAITLIHLFFSSSKPNNAKLLWTLVIVFGNMLVLPIYWYLIIWKEENASPADSA